MVQVDVFWSYALGAGFALSAARQIALEAPCSQEEERPASSPEWWQARSFVQTLLFLALVFVPSGTYLLAEFPSWETMHVAGDRDAVPSWLVTVFTFTNVSQGVLGYWVVRKLIQARWWRLAQAQWLLGYFGMFFVLVHGWDGSGFVRFFSAEPGWVAGWQATDVLRWVTSPVALTLGVMGLVLLPLMLGWMSTWIRVGQQEDPACGAPRSRGALIGLILVGPLGVSLGAAIAASGCVRLAGWGFGGLGFVLAAWAIVLRREGLLMSYGTWLLGPLSEGSTASPPPVNGGALVGC